MIDVIPLVKKTLENDFKLVQLLGGKHVSNMASPHKFPSITFFEMNNMDTQTADNEDYASSISIQIDVWDKKPPNPIAKEVDRVMKSLGFFRFGTADIFEEDTKIYHKGLRYRIVKEEDEGL